MLILGLLRMRICSHEHFKVIFGEQKVQQLKASEDFIDTKKEVPFIGDFEDNPRLAKMTPSFKKMEELFGYIKKAKASLKEAEARKSATYFKRVTETKRIG